MNPGNAARITWIDVDRYGIWIVLVAASIFRLAAVAQHGVRYLGGFSDAIGYVESARVLARTGELTFYGVHHSALVMPGFVAILAAIFVPPWSAEVAYTVMKLSLVAMSVASVYVLYRIGMAVGGRRTGLLGAAIMAFSVPSVYTATLPLTENPFALLVLSFILAVIRCAETPSWRRFAIALVLLTCGLYVRQTMLGLIPPAVVYLLVKRYPARMLVSQSATAVVVVAIALAPWVIRNYCVFNAFVPLTTADSAPFFEGAFQRFDPAEATRLANARADEILSTVGPSDAMRNQALNDAGRERLIERWQTDKLDLLLTYAVFKPAAAWLLSFYWDPVFGISSRLVLWIHAAMTATGLAALAWLAIYSRHRAEFLFLLLNVIMITVGVSYYLGLSRYVYPFTPLLSVALAHVVLRVLAARTVDGKWSLNAAEF